MDPKDGKNLSEGKGHCKDFGRDRVCYNNGFTIQKELPLVVNIEMWN